MTHERILQDAERLRNTLRDWLDQPTHQQARLLEQAADRLISDTRGKKRRDALDNDVKQVINVLRQVEQDVMDHHHSDHLQGMYENLRNLISKLP